MKGKTNVPRPERKFWQWWVMAAAAITLAACGGSDADTSNGDVSATRTLPPLTATPTPEPSPPAPTATDLPSAASVGATAAAENQPDEAGVAVDRALEMTLNDLIAQGINPDNIRLLTLEAARWTDRTWGCATTPAAFDPGRGPRSGFRIVYRTGAGVVAYHTDTNEHYFTCDDPDWIIPRGQPLAPDPIAESMIEMARALAADRLAIAPDELALDSLISVNWPDSSLGCPRPNAEYDPRVTAGYRIVFTAGDSQAIYHTSVRDAIYCAPEEEILPGLLRDSLASTAPAS